MRTSQDASMGSVHDVSSVLWTLFKEGALRTNVPEISAFSGEAGKGEVSFDQWSYELQTLRKSHSDLVLREGIQHSIRGAAADVVCNMGPNVPLDMILKKFTIIYGNVKSFDLLMRDFYRADQGEDETIPSFATIIKGLLSQISDKFPGQPPLQEKQRLLKDCLFHGSQKSIQDSLKYCFADASIDYMQFLEECQKSEEEGKAGQARAPAKVKVRAAAATLPPNKDDGLSKQLKYQQHQIDALVGQVKGLMAVVKATHSSPRVGKSGPSFMEKGTQVRESLPKTEVKTHKQGKEGRIQINNTNAAVCRGGAFKKRIPFFRRQRAVSKGECRSSPQGLKRHSPYKQPQVEASIGVKSVTNGGVTDEDLVGEKGTSPYGSMGETIRQSQ